MKRIDKILDNKENINIDFAVHVKNQNELKDLIEILQKHGFKIELNLFDENLSIWMFRVAQEDKYDTCFRIRNRENDKCVAWNPSIEHWRSYCRDIIELENGEIVFNEGEYTQQAAETEADKIISDIAQSSYLKKIYGDMTRDQIIYSLLHNR